MSWNTAGAPPGQATRAGNCAVDLTGVTFIDQAGRYLLQLLHRDGVRFVASSLMLQDILDHITGTTE